MGSKTSEYQTGSAQWFVDPIKVDEFTSFDYKSGGIKSKSLMKI